MLSLPSGILEKREKEKQSSIVERKEVTLPADWTTATEIGQITAQLGSQFDMPQGAGSQALGRVKQKQLPSPGSPELSAQICPCIASINRLLM